MFYLLNVGEYISNQEQHSNQVWRESNSVYLAAIKMVKKKLYFKVNLFSKDYRQYYYTTFT